MTLFEDFTQWGQQLRRVWLDQIDPMANVDFVVVRPGPAPLEPQIPRHVMLLQHTLPTMSSSLVTVQDTAIQQGGTFAL